MLIDNVQFRIDGGIIENDLIETFHLRENSRNLRYSSDEKKDVLNFVGFIIKNNQMLVSMPKHYCNKENLVMLGENDINLLFNTLLKHQFSQNQSYIGAQDDFDSNYPFKAFFDIYSYFQKYGLYQVIHNVIKPGYSGKIIWKDTLRKSEVIVSKKSIIFAPLYIKKSYTEQVFLSQCMIYVINYTLNQFSSFIKLKPIQGNIIQTDIFENKDFVISKLHAISSKIFKDHEKKLLLSLLDFFLKVDKGGSIVFKHYNFELVWETMVGQYLNRYFVKMEDNLPIFNTTKKLNQKRFSKGKFYINKVQPTQKIEPDHYYFNDNKQYIFDSKYYTSLNRLDYKQVTYFTILHELTKGDTFSILILPTEKENYSELFFELDDRYYNNPKDQIIITSTYLNMLNVMKAYILI